MRFNNLDFLIRHIGVQNQSTRLYAVYTDFYLQFGQMKGLIERDLYDFHTDILEVDFAFKQPQYWWNQQVFITLYSIPSKINNNKFLDTLKTLNTLNPEIGKIYELDYFDLFNLICSGKLIFFTSLNEAQNYLKESYTMLYKASIKDFDERLKKYKKRMYKKLGDSNIKIKEFNQIIKAAKKYKYKLHQYANS